MAPQPSEPRICAAIFSVCPFRFVVHCAYMFFGGIGMPINPMLDATMVTTALELPGFRIVRNCGVVRGIVVRSRSIFGTIGAGLQTLAGGNISIYSQLCEKTREDAFELMMQHAAQHGANAIVCARYDANDIQQGVTEVLAYGTAVIVERVA
jgi:uncharacterized protein YbjQ (UPF0145 family)